jgi:hypothetical protein
LVEQFVRKGEAVVKENVDLARVGYEYAATNFQPFESRCPRQRTATQC